MVARVSKYVVLALVASSLTLTAWTYTATGVFPSQQRGLLEHLLLRSTLRNSTSAQAPRGNVLCHEGPPGPLFPFSNSSFAQSGDTGEVESTAHQLWAKVLAMQHSLRSNHVQDLWPNITVPFDVLDAMNAASEAFVGSVSDESLRQLFVSLVDGAPLKMVALGGSTTAGWELHRWPFRVFKWLTSVFLNLESALKNSAISASQASAPLSCLPEFLGENANLVILEYNINDSPVRECKELVKRVLEYEGRKPRAVLNLNVFSCHVYSCTDSSFTTEATMTRAAQSSNLSTISVAAGVEPYFQRINETLDVKSPRYFSPETLFENEGHLHHFNDLGHNLAAYFLQRHLKKTFLEVSWDDVLTQLQARRQSNSSSQLCREQYRCFTTNWAGALKVDQTESSMLRRLRPLWNSSEWELRILRVANYHRDKEVYASSVNGSSIVFPLDLATPSQVSIGFLWTKDLGLASLALGNHTFTLNGRGFGDARLVRFFDCDRKVFEQGYYNATITTLEDAGFQVIGLFSQPVC